MMKPWISLFPEHERRGRREELGDPLGGLSTHADFVALASGIGTAAPRPSRAKGGGPPYPPLLMVKILVLQQLYNLADDVLEYERFDRRSFLQFLDLAKSSSIPDSKTIRRFPECLAQAAVGPQVFEQRQQQLQEYGDMGLRPDRRHLFGANAGSVQQAQGGRDRKGRNDAPDLEATQACTKR